MKSGIGGGNKCDALPKPHKTSKQLPPASARSDLEAEVALDHDDHGRLLEHVDLAQPPHVLVDERVLLLGLCGARQAQLEHARL